MPFLYLIRHPKTRPDPAVPSSRWRLAEEGHAQVRALVVAPFWKGVAAVYTSQQTKTIVVGEAVHAAHGIPFTAVEALGEAQRDEWLGDVAAFQAAQTAFFAQPSDSPVPSWESAESAGGRFSAAMGEILARHARAESLVIVSHASVLTLYVARLRAEAPSYEEWSRMGFAVVMAVDRATLRPATPFLAAPYGGLPVP